MLLLASSITVDAHHHRHCRPRNGGGNVATPLDGGLLTVLGAAGIGYYLFRRNSKKEKS